MVYVYNTYDYFERFLQEIFANLDFKWYYALGARMLLTITLFPQETRLYFMFFCELKHIWNKIQFVHEDQTYHWPVLSKYTGRVGGTWVWDDFLQFQPNSSIFDNLRFDFVSEIGVFSH